MEKEIINEICQNAKKYEIIIIKLFAKIFVKAYHTGRLKCLNNIISKWLYQTEYGGAYSIWYNLYCKSSVEAVLLNSILSINRWEISYFLWTSTLGLDKIS